MPLCTTPRRSGPRPSASSTRRIVSDTHRMRSTPQVYFWRLKSSTLRLWIEKSTRRDTTVAGRRPPASFAPSTPRVCAWLVCMWIRSTPRSRTRRAMAQAAGRSTSPRIERRHTGSPHCSARVASTPSGWHSSSCSTPAAASPRMR